MAEVMTVDELRRAAGNLKRIEEYFATRTGWRPEPGALEALRQAGEAAGVMIRAIDLRLDAHGISVDVQGRDAEQLPPDRFDPSRLSKVAAFMVALGEWFRANSHAALEAGAGSQLGEAYGSLQAIQLALHRILGGDATGATPPDEPMATAPTAAASELFDPAHEAGLPAPAAAVVGPDRPLAMPAAHALAAGPGPTAAPARVREGDRLVLEDTEQKPLLQTFKGETELTPEARQVVAEFLDRNQVELSRYQRLKFEVEVQRRIQGTPLGHLLVIKIGDMDGRPRPFFRYQAKQLDQPAPEEAKPE